LPKQLPDEAVYLRTHARRYELVFDLARNVAPATVLVVGPSHDSVLLRDVLPGVAIDTLGWADHRFPRIDGERHFEHDLNDADYPAVGPYDLIVCGEVLEHLHVAPVPVLRHFAAALEPGGRLILQTPNATALPKRLRMLVGRNPADPIRDEPRNPGHFHEFTVRELLRAVEDAGLEVERWLAENYFDHGSRKNRAFRTVGAALPRTLREGITVVARRRR
jgi:SAM-dependent methyltransferase